jgi:rhomboid protease GluP
MWGWAPVLRRLGNDLGFVQVVTWGCVALYVACLIVDPSNLTGGGGGLFGFLAPSGRSLFLFGASGTIPVLGYGRWWTVLSAGWLHGGLLHIFFNLLWIRQLAPTCAELYGAGRTVILYTVASVTGFLFTSLSFFAPGIFRAVLGAGGLTVGASAAIFGLLGALVHYSRRTGSSQVGRMAWTYAVVLFVLGLFLRFVDNWAHLGGFLGGWGISYLLDPMRPERGDHQLVALLCLLLSVLAVVVSYFTGLKILLPPELAR